MIKAKTKGYRDLIVWQKSYQLAIEVYKLTKNFPKEEIYGLSQQMRRASVSIPSNIAEGYARQYSKEYKQFLSIAYGSVCELETQYHLCIDLEYSAKHEFTYNLIRETGAMLYRMINPIRS